MKKTLIIISICFFMPSCMNKPFESELKSIVVSDSLIHKSKELGDSSVLVLKFADQKTAEIVEKVVEKVQTLEKEKIALQKTSKVNTVYVHDTVFITEKKNFWGKTKTKVDSTKGIDSLQNK